MTQVVSFRAGDELWDRIHEEMDEAERESGYRPKRSDVARNALCDYFGIGEENSDSVAERGEA